jgi:Mg/Co/Ni transporter MgtE
MDQPTPQLQKLFSMYETIIRPRMEEKNKKLGIIQQENIISESNNSKEDVRSSGTTENVNNK